LLFTPTPFSSWTATFTLTPPPPPINCPPRPGWLIYFVQPGETLDSIATRYQVSSAELQSANCMISKDLLPGVVIYIPPIRTQPPLPCGVPYGWVVYTVQSGDTLYRLSLTYGTTVARLRSANCLGSSPLLHTGQTLYIPDQPPLPAQPTAPGIFVPTNTPVPGQPTSVPTDTLIPTTTDTPALEPTATPIPVTP
jgi:LysM repeat protein